MNITILPGSCVCVAKNNHCLKAQIFIVVDNCKAGKKIYTEKTGIQKENIE